MSGSVGPSFGVSDPRFKTPEKTVDVTSVAVRNADTGEWETPQMDQASLTMIRSAITEIQRIGARTQSGPLKRLSEEGIELELTADGIFAREGQKWTNLLTDTVASETRDEIASSLQTIADAVKTISQKSLAPADVATTASELPAGDVVIQVNVLPFTLKLDAGLKQETEFQAQLNKSAEVLTQKSVKHTLLEKGLSKEQVREFPAKLGALVAAKERVVDIMSKAQELVQKGKDREASAYYNKHMPEAYGKFCDALREWQIVYNKVESLLPQEVRDQVNISFEQYHVQAGATALPSIQKIEKNLATWEKTVATASERFENAQDTERAFNEKIAEAISAFEDPAFIQDLKKMKWSDQDISDHKARLADLKEQSDKARKLLQDAHRLISLGDVQGGMKLYSDGLTELFGDYAAACRALVIPQNVAQGRALLESLPPELELPLSTVEHHALLLEGMIKTVEDAAITDASNKKVLDTSSWQVRLEAMKPAQDDLRQTQTQSSFALKLNEDHEKQHKFTARLGAFVRAYRENRELFDALMRQQGISELESAQLFNHYENLYLALEERDRGMQHVVDLANQQKPAEALEAYTRLVESVYPKIHAASLPTLFFDTTQLGSRSVKVALREFNDQLGFARDEFEIMEDLSRQHNGSEAKKLLEGYLQLAEASELPFPRNTQVARDLIDKLSKEDSVKQKEHEALVTDQGKRLQNFFNTDVQTAHRLKQEWLYLLEKYQWGSKAILHFSALMNRYAALVRPLREAQLAVENETNPQKKRALQAQLRELARVQLPELNKLNAELKAAGGLAQLATVLSAVDGLEKQSKSQGVPAGMMEEARALVRLLQDRSRFLNKLYEDVGVYKPVAKNTVSSLVLQGPHVDDPDLVEKLKDNGKWTLEQVKGVSEWCDAYFNAGDPIRRAKEALDADPENIVLQKAFKKVMEEKLPILEKLEEKWRSSYGKERWNDLKAGVEAYRQHISTRLTSVEGTLATPNLDKHLREVAEKDQADFQSTQRLLKPLDGVETRILETTNFIPQAIRAYNLPKSWDKDYLSLLAPAADSPLMSLKTGPKSEPLWPQLLKTRGLEAKDVSQILKLLHDYQTQLKKMAQLERQLEAAPDDMKLQQQLRSEMQARKPALDALQKRFDALSEKISNLEQAIADFHRHLTKGTEALTENKEVLEAAQPGSQAAATYQTQAKVLRERYFGNLPEGQETTLTRLSGEISIAGAFAAKQSFVEETYRRFPIAAKRGGSR